MVNSILSLSPNEFQHFYTLMDNYDNIHPRNQAQKDRPPFFGYIAPTERPIRRPSPTFKHGGTPFRDRVNDRHTYSQFSRPRPTDASSDNYQIYFHDKYLNKDRGTSTFDPQSYSGIDRGSTRLEQVQNLVHLRNQYSLAQSTNLKRKIPYGFIRNGKKMLTEHPLFTRMETDGSTRQTWTAKAIVEDLHGEESMVIERGTRYKGPYPTPTTENRYSSIEIATLPSNVFRERRSFMWNTDNTENSITKRPINTILKPHKNNESSTEKLAIQSPTEDDQLELPLSRSVLRRFTEPIVFKTKVSASVGVEPDSPVDHFETRFPVLVSSESGNLVFSLQQQSTPAQSFEPLASPPIPSSATSSYGSQISTTAQIEQQAVLSSPQDPNSPAQAGTTQSSYGINDSSSYGSDGFVPSYGGLASYGPPSGGLYGSASGPSSYGSSTSSTTKVPGRNGPPTTLLPSIFNSDRFAQSEYGNAALGFIVTNNIR